MQNKEIIGISSPAIATSTLSDDKKLADLLNGIKNKYPKYADGKIILPAVEDENYTVSLYGSGNTAVITEDLRVIKPLEDMTVNLFYRITNNATGESLETDNPITVRVRGMYNDGNKNRPEVLPAIREWKGNDGTFFFSGNIVIIDNSLNNAAEQAVLYIKELTHNSVNITTNTAAKGDILLVRDMSLPVGDEGYTLDIGDNLILTSTTERGIIYGAATIAQIMMQSEDKRSLPKGLARDYPQYPVRGFMIDTARYHIGIEYLEEVTKYAAFYKMNQVHLHLNDGAGETNTSFRIKSDKYPELNRAYTEACENGEEKLYTKKQYIDYQKEIMKYGIEVVSEIDTPSHCGAIVDASKSEEAKKNGFSSVELNNWQLDLRDEKFEETLKFVQSVYEEFLGGEAPIFLSDKVHIGTDEWVRDAGAKEYSVTEYGITNEERNELMRKYMDSMIKYINAKGKTPVLWNGMNKDGVRYGGKTPVCRDAIFQTWALCFSDIEEIFKNEYPTINSNDVDLYIVPGVTYYKTDLDIAKMYDDWEVGTFSSYEEFNTGNRCERKYIPDGHPLLLGAETAFWLDAGCGSSHIDLFKLLKNQIMLMCEKTWYGAKTERQTVTQYMKRVGNLGNFAPTVNPGRYNTADSDGIIANFDLSKPCDTFKINRLCTDNENRAILLDGNGFVSSSIKTVSDPYTVIFDILLSGENPSDAVMFEGEDGVMYYNYDNSGKIAFKRKGYTYIFDYIVPVDMLLHLVISCDGKKTYLYSDGKLVSEAEYLKSEYELDPAPIRTLYTFQLPLEKIGSGIKGALYGIKVINKACDDNQLNEEFS